MKGDFRLRVRLFVAVLAVVILSAAFLIPATNADELYGRIRGAVLDPSGAGVPDVQIQLLNADTGIKEQTVSGSDGSYIFLNLKPGKYNLSAQKSGFRTFDVRGIQVEPNEIHVQNISMELGTVSQVVEVAANQVQVEQSSMQLTSSIDSKTVTDLPLNGRNWIYLQQTLPGVVVPDTRFNTNFSTMAARASKTATW